MGRRKAELKPDPFYVLQCTLCTGWSRTVPSSRCDEVARRHEATRHRKAKTVWRRLREGQHGA